MLRDLTLIKCLGLTCCTILAKASFTFNNSQISPNVSAGLGKSLGIFLD